MLMISTGIGKMIVEFRSVAISAIVCSVRSCIAPGFAAIVSAASPELLRRLELAVGRDDLRPPLALGLGLARHRALHLLGQPDVADLDEVDLHAPRLGLLVERGLQLGVDAVALTEQLVELVAADDRTQRRLRDELRGVEPVLDLDAPTRRDPSRGSTRPRRPPPSRCPW